MPVPKAIKGLKPGQLLIRCCACLLAILAIILAIITVPPLPASAAARVETPHARVELISEVASVRAGDAFAVALRFQLAEGWHIYWRNPGDSGAKPRVDWTLLPAGFEVGEIQWPWPERLPAGPLMNFGYEGEVLLPSPVVPPTDLGAGTVTLQADVDWLVCKIDCIPESGTLELQLPVGTAAPQLDARWRDRFAKTRAALPEPLPGTASARTSATELFLQLDLPAEIAARVERASFFPDFDGAIVNAAEQTLEIAGNRLTLAMQRGYLPEIEALSGVLTLEQGAAEGVRAFTVPPVAVTPQALEPTTATDSGVASTPLWRIFGLALCGGIILNLMPCVFPVLSLKALGIAQKVRKHPQQIRLQVLAFTVGVVASLTAVAGGLLALRSLGQEIGWGFQLQSPAFVMVLAYLLFGIGLNLSGVFVFGATWMGVGQRLTERPGYVGEFFSGVLATVVATPCTAPFMATAIGAALTQPAWVALAIFAVLGLGLALPYGAVALLPSLQRCLPKPGAWMETLQQLLAFPLYGAAAWLVWVLVRQAGSAALAAVLGGFIALGFAAWLYQKTRSSPQLGRRLGAAASLALLGFALTLARVPVPGEIVGTANSPAAVSQTTLPWEPYSPDRLATLRQQGQPVFVNFTADWCITCLVNDRGVFRRPEVVAAFADRGVVALKGDWTNRDRTVTAALESFGRSGVPFYAFYPPAAEPVVLPQILSVQAIEAVLE